MVVAYSFTKMSRFRTFLRGVGLAVTMAAAAGCLSPLVYYAGPPRNAILPVVAVTSFENRSSYSGQWRLGDGMADLLVSELVASRRFTVVERVELPTIFKELERQVTGNRFRPEGRADAGRLKNARYMIRGVINDFSQVSKTSFFLGIERLLLGGKGYKARVSLTVTLVDVETGEILASVQSAGTARAREAYVSAQYKDVMFGGDAFFRTPLGVATADSIRRAVHEIAAAVPRSMWRPLVASVLPDGRVALNGGRDRGFAVGQVFEARERGAPVTDPATGDVLGVLEGKRVGTLRVSEVQDRIAFATPLDGRGFERGQFLMPPATRVGR